MHTSTPGSAAPTLTAEPVAPAEFNAWRASVVEAYAADLATNGGLTAVQAIRKAESDTASLLPDGVLTPGHEIYWLRVGEAAGAGVPASSIRIGRLWVAERTSHGTPILFVYDVAIDPQHRARGLYSSLGYDERAVTMGKHLGAAGQSR